MLQVQISEHKLGLFIEGDYHDLNMLYKSLESIITNECFKDMKASCNCIYSTMYDVRKAMNGEREFDVFQNQLDTEILRELSVKDDTSIYYGFYVMLPEIMFIVLSLHLLEKDSINDIYYYYLRMFISLVISSFEEEGMNIAKMKDFFNQVPTYTLHHYYHQYVEVSTLNLLDTHEDDRLAMIESLLYDLVTFSEEYKSLVKEVDEYAKENGCNPIEITYLNSLDDIEY